MREAPDSPAGSGRSGTAPCTIRTARRDEADALAAIIREAFATEAAEYGDIPPLHETAADLEATFDAGEVTLVADLDGRTIGTVRGETMPDGTIMVRRLAVLPDVRGLGIGRALLVALEAAYPQAVRFELFTGDRSGMALGLYESLGYLHIGTTEIAPGVTLVSLEKLVG